MDSYNSNDPQIAFISIEKERYRKFHFITNIVVTRQKTDCLPIIDDNGEYPTTCFQISAKDSDDYSLKKIHMIKYIFEVFSPDIFIGKHIIVWNLSKYYTAKQVGELIVYKLYDDDFFTGAVRLGISRDEGVVPFPRRVPLDELGNVFVMTPTMRIDLIRSNINNSGIRWFFNYLKEKRTLSLVVLASYQSAKICLRKTVFDDEFDQYDYFNKREIPLKLHYYNYIIESFFSRMNPFNLCLLVKQPKLSTFKNNYLDNVNLMELPQTLVRKLWNYCPKDNDIINEILFLED